MGGMSIVGAIYGTGTIPQLVVERVVGEDEVDLGFIPLETFFDGRPDPRTDELLGSR